MGDWRLEGLPESFLKNETLERIVFPDFWLKSYSTKNDFYKIIKLDGETFVQRYKRGEEYLEGDKIQDFWHSHCAFCTEKITTRDERICFCTKDYSEWICKTCYDDLNEQFNWHLTS